MKKRFSITLVAFSALVVLLATGCCSNCDKSSNFNQAWKFHLIADTTLNGADYSKTEFDDSKWESVELPHTAYVEEYSVREAWMGICWYRKNLVIESYSSSKNYFIEFEAAMNICEVWINGEKVKTAQGGYLPVVLDATPYVKKGENVVAVRLDNRFNPVTGPKPLHKLDFIMYSGLYRKANFVEKGEVYITNPNLVDKVAGGGIFISYPLVTAKEAKVNVKADLANSSSEAKEVVITTKIFKNKRVVIEQSSEPIIIGGNKSIVDNKTFSVYKPELWSPSSPELYTMQTLVMAGADTLDVNNTTFGIRKFEFRKNQLFINGVKTKLRGVNRHQEYPYVGYAMSDNAQYRDAQKIKDGGSDYVRLSHYPQSPAFMAACDSLGLVVLNDVLGWQYYNDTKEFKEQQYSQARQLIRRDRNHPCVLAWEVSLNETKMPVEFMEQMHKIAHKEHPGKNVYTAGWQPEVYDIYLQARQHRILHKDQVSFKKPYSVSEYGDWEYYSNNAGLNQHKLNKNDRKVMSTRQYRRDGEQRMLLQAHNVQEAHNDNLTTPAFGDTFWVMYDYNSGCNPDKCNSGMMDTNRLPKFSYYFYQSQRSIEESGKPVLFIASYWDANSALDIKVFSNCDEVELFVNGKSTGKQSPDKNNISNKLNHPPFTFKVAKYSEGSLKAIGYKDGKKVAEHIVNTPKSSVALKCWVDVSSKPAQANCNDNLFLYIAAVDENGTIVPTYDKDVEITLPEGIKLLNKNGKIVSEAGIATALIQIGSVKGNLPVTATSEGLKGECVVEVL